MRNKVAAAGWGKSFGTARIGEGRLAGVKQKKSHDGPNTTLLTRALTENTNTNVDIILKSSV